MKDSKELVDELVALVSRRNAVKDAQRLLQSRDESKYLQDTLRGISNRIGDEIVSVAKRIAS